MINDLNAISPLDYRYSDDRIIMYLSGKIFVATQLEVESALAQTLYEYNLCSKEIADDISAACEMVNPNDVYKEEQRIHHDARAMVNCIKAKLLCPDSGSFVHFCATSYDIIDTANNIVYFRAINELLIPQLNDLVKVIIRLTEEEAKTVQIGRTHGQHAVPITFGWAMSGYVNRLGEGTLYLENLSKSLSGKFSGAVGAYNSSSLFLGTAAIQFEKDLLEKLGVYPSSPSTQIIPPEDKNRTFFEILLIAGIMADLADDMRHLQRTEISEIKEEFEKNQVGSSTMSQKQNPINFENVKGMWKIVAPKIITMLMNQMSEHQRDLTNSVSSRTDSEIIAYTFLMAERLTKTMAKIIVDQEKMKENLKMQGELILAEPIQLLLSFYGCPDAHEKIRILSLESKEKKISLMELVRKNPEFKDYLARLTPDQLEIIQSPENYIGLSVQEAEATAIRWRKILEI